MKRLVLALAMILAWSPWALAAGPQHHEQIEWTWTDQPAAPNPGLPDVLLVGDSITRNYYPFVTQALAGRANVFLFSTSASAGDERLDGQIAEYARMIDRRFAVVHFNNGMHGWDYSEAEYGASLPGLIAALRAAAPGARLVWAATTPVRADAVGGAANARIDARNAIAAGFMATQSIPIDDQHALMAGRTALYTDDVHFAAAGAAIQGAAAAAAIAGWLH